MKQILSISLLLISLFCEGQKTLLFQEKNIPALPQDDEIVLRWNESQPGYNSLSQQEKDFFYWVNYSRENPGLFYEKAVKRIVNTFPQLKGANLTSLEKDLKSGKGLPLLKLQSSLLKMSQAHAKDITSNAATPSHNSTSGESFVDRFKKNGLKNCGGENISYGGEQANPLFMLVMLYLDINVDNLGHRKALLNPAFVNTGIAISKYENGNVFLVEDFACSQE